MQEEILIEEFFSWRPYKLILYRLDKLYGIKRGITWLKSEFKKLGLRRRSQLCIQSEPTIRVIIRMLLRSSESQRGYRSIWKVLRDRANEIIRDTVMKLLKEEDPEGVAERKKRRLKRRIYSNNGPNYIWHLDGYNKLTPFGIDIHGCIDGYSRKILWLEMTPTNHDSKVVSRFFLEAIEKNEGCPTVVRSDYGTENTRIATCQLAFRLNHSDSLAKKSFMYGPSKSNIRIEAWWSQLRRFKSGWWIHFCKELEHEQLIDTRNPLHKKILVFTIGHLLEKELNAFKDNWNSHRMRKNRTTGFPGGIPDDLYLLPELAGGVQCLQSINSDLWLHAMMNESCACPRFYSTTFERVTSELLQHVRGITRESITIDNCKDVYTELSQLYDQL